MATKRTGTVDNVGGRAESVPTGLVTTTPSIDMNLLALLKELKDSGNGVRSYNVGFAPKGGWRYWCRWAAMQGMNAKIIRTMSKNVMSWDWKGKNQKALKAIRRVSRKVHLKMTLIGGYMDWLIDGAQAYEPVWTYSDTTKQKRTGLEKVKRLDIDTITVVRDSEKEINDLKGNIRDEEKRSYVEGLETGSGDNIVAYVQHYNPTQGHRQVIFEPGELIFIPRYETHVYQYQFRSIGNPNGISLLQENYHIITSKMLLEDALIMLGRLFTMPRMIHELPENMWVKRKEVAQSLRNRYTAGLDSLVPSGTRSTILKVEGGDVGLKVLEYIKQEYTAAMGFSDSFTESDSSNRSVGEIQLEFFQRDIEPEREFFEEILEDQLIRPILEIEGFTDEDDIPQFDWKELTSEDYLSWASMMLGIMDEMDSGQLKEFFEYIGLPVTDDEWKDREKQIKERWKEPENPAPADPGTPSEDPNNPDKKPAEKGGDTPPESGTMTAGSRKRKRDLRAGVSRREEKIARDIAESITNSMAVMQEEVANVVSAL